jgi:hypothetical protein
MTLQSICWITIVSRSWMKKSDRQVGCCSLWIWISNLKSNWSMQQILQ